MDPVVRGLVRLALILAVLVIVGCRSMRRDDLIGTWVLQSSSRTVLPIDLQHTDGRFVFVRDGTFICTGVPALFFEPERSPARAENGHGTWRLIREDGNEEVLLNFRAIDNWNKALPYGTTLFVSGKHLEFFLGDPDQGRAVQFEKMTAGSLRRLAAPVALDVAGFGRALFCHFENAGGAPGFRGSDGWCSCGAEQNIADAGVEQPVISGG